MKFYFKKLGPIKEAEIELADITVLTGLNNQGKTYISYSVYGFYNNWQNYIDEILYSEKDYGQKLTDNIINIDLQDLYSENVINRICSALSKQYSESLNSLFASESLFSDTHIAIRGMQPLSYEQLYSKAHKDKGKTYDIDICLLEKSENSNLIRVIRVDNNKYPDWFVVNAINQALFKMMFGIHIRNPFVITSERTGISLFYKELDINKNILIEEISSGVKFNPFDFIAKSTSRYAIPIHHNINYIRDTEALKKTTSMLTKDSECVDSIIDFWDRILGGKYKIENGNIMFKAKGVRRAIPLFISSSSVKSLFSLDLFITHFAQKNDILIIDEPELNLHPRSQVLLARLFARMANKGIRVFITTHSDYLVYELNNLVMAHSLSSDDDLIKSLDYEKCELLQPHKLKVYNINKGGLKESKIDKYGVDAKTFSKVTDELSKRANILSAQL